MAYDEYLAERIRRVFAEKHINTLEKKMMGGLCYMLNDKMCVGLLQEKASGRSLLMARIGPDAYPSALAKEGVSEMTFTGRSMKGYVFVHEEAMDNEEDLAHWIDLAVAFNPLAKASKKRKPKR